MPRGPTQWPWISMTIALLAAVSGVGRDFLHSAFVSYDQLGRNIARPIVLSAIAVMMVVGLGEFLLRTWIRKRRGRS